MSGTGVVTFLFVCLLAYLAYRLMRRVKKHTEKIKAQEQAIQLVRLEVSRTAAATAAAQTMRSFNSNMGPTSIEIPIAEPPPVYNPSAPQPASVSCSQRDAANEGGTQH